MGVAWIRCEGSMTSTSSLKCGIEEGKALSLVPAHSEFASNTD